MGGSSLFRVRVNYVCMGIPFTGVHVPIMHAYIFACIFCANDIRYSSLGSYGISTISLKCKTAINIYSVSTCVFTLPQFYIRRAWEWTRCVVCMRKWTCVFYFMKAIRGLLHMVLRLITKTICLENSTLRHTAQDARYQELRIMKRTHFAFSASTVDAVGLIIHVSTLNRQLNRPTSPNSCLTYSMLQHWQFKIYRPRPRGMAIWVCHSFHSALWLSETQLY